MNSLRSFTLGCALLVGALGLSPYAGPTDNHEAALGAVLAEMDHGYRLPPHSELFPKPAGNLVIEDVSLEALIHEFGRVTGERMIYSQDTGQLLSTMKTRIGEPLEVPPDEVYSVFQSVLIANRFVLTNMRREEPRMLGVVSMDSPARASMKASATYVPIEQLHEYAKDSAFLVTTIIPLPNLSVRTMGASTRQLVVDPNTMQIIPVPESNQIILTAFGDAAWNMANLFRDLDSRAAVDAELLKEKAMNRALLEAAKRLGVDSEE